MHLRFEGCVGGQSTSWESSHHDRKMKVRDSLPQSQINPLLPRPPCPYRIAVRITTSISCRGRILGGGSKFESGAETRCSRAPNGGMDYHSVTTGVHACGTQSRAL